MSRCVGTRRTRNDGGESRSLHPIFLKISRPESTATKLRSYVVRWVSTRNQPPSVYLESHHDRWKNTFNSHIESNWKLCLFVPGESGIVFADPASLKDLFAVIHTFLFKQRIYQRRLAKTYITGGEAEWPGEDRSHGEEGIREAIQAIGSVGRNDPCPCGNGLKYKKCHMRKSKRK